MNPPTIKRLMLAYAVCGVGIFAVAWCCFGQPVPCEQQARQVADDRKPLPETVGETPEPPLAVDPDDADGRLIRRLSGRKDFEGVLDRHFARKLPEAIDQACAEIEGDVKRGFWGAAAQALVKIIRTVMRLLFVFVLWDVISTYWYIVAPAGVMLFGAIVWLASVRAAAKVAPPVVVVKADPEKDKGA